ncbi:MAG: hypothetical protein LBQ65_09715 [Tannerellaceae bacterium]|jgi:hypothetical protein|nr:hypothetical protein [Tannerellaceae bacterium]
MMTKTPIRHRDIAAIIEAKDEKGNRLPFSATVFTHDGRLMKLENVSCTSSYHGGTYNLRLENGQIRKVHGLLFTEINGMEVFV